MVSFIDHTEGLNDGFIMRFVIRCTVKHIIKCIHQRNVSMSESNQMASNQIAAIK